MLALFSLILVLVGCANWLCIGLLQFDFVAGIFGSQSNIFSRIVYVIVGVASVILAINIIKNKGKIGFNFKKIKLKKAPQPTTQMETGHDNTKQEQYSNPQPTQHANFQTQPMQQTAQYQQSQSEQYNQPTQSQPTQPQHEQYQAKNNQPQSTNSQEYGQNTHHNDMKSISEKLSAKHNENRNK